MIDSTQA